MAAKEDVRIKFFDTMKKEDETVTNKYIAFYEIKSLGGKESAELLKQAFPYQGESELLKHEIVYTLGQMKYSELASFFKELIEDEKQYPIVRHEAAEALANLNEPEHIEFLKKHVDSSVEELKDTCRVALGRLANEKVDERTGLKYGGTLEPAVPFSKEELLQLLAKTHNETTEAVEKNFHEYIMKTVTDANQDLYSKYRIIYYLRDECSEEGIKLLGKLLAPEYREGTGAILRHEVGFVAGQLADKAKPMEEALKKNIEDATENPIVRHEAIAGYSSCSQDVEFLKPFLKDEARVVRESAIIAVDMIDYWSH